MKKLLSLLLSCLLFFMCFNITAFASESDESKIYFDDGSYIVTVITESPSRATNTKSGTKEIKYYDSNDNLEWKVTLTGNFSYTGSSATCTKATINYNIYNDKWKIPTATASKSGNKATGDVVAKHYTLGIPFKTIERTITLTCSASGTLS